MLYPKVLFCCYSYSSSYTALFDLKETFVQSFDKCMLGTYMCLMLSQVKATEWSGENEVLEPVRLLDERGLGTYLCVEVNVRAILPACTMFLR